MTEFAQELRHRCRYTKCRSKLPAPVENERLAFCKKGCFTSYYRHLCVVCEQPFKRKRENQHVCGRPSCRPAFRNNRGQFDPAGHLGSPRLQVAPKTSIKPGLKTAPAGDRPWHIVAGQELTPTQFHCAAVGADEANEASRKINARYWREANAKAEERCCIKRHDPPVNIVGGYKFPGTPNIDLSQIATAPAPTDDYAWSSWQPYPSAWRPIVDRPVEPPSPDDLSIPAFLGR